MTGRSVPEWIGATPDTPIPPRVRLRVFERFGGICYLSGRKIMPGDKWEVEHVKGLAFYGENRESNLAPALVAPHKEKSSRERTAQAKCDRQRAKHLGIYPKSKRPLQGRPFAKRGEVRS